MITRQTLYGTIIPTHNQDIILNNICKHDRLLVFSYKSDLIQNELCMNALLFALNNDNANVAYISPHIRSSQAITKYLYELVPDKSEVTSSTRFRIDFKNGSTIYCATHLPKATSFCFIVYDLLERIEMNNGNFENEFIAGLSSVNPNGKCIINMNRALKECHVSRMLAINAYCGNNNWQWIFCPWYRDSINVSPYRTSWPEEYIEEIQAVIGVKLTPEQKNWFAERYNDYRYFPSFIEEALFS